MKPALAAACFFLFVQVSEGQARTMDFGPWSATYRHPVISTIPQHDTATADHHEPAHTVEKKTGHGISRQGSSFFVVFFKLWSGVLTRIDGPRCSHKPTCSAFTRKALAVHGLVLGFWISLSRLTRGAGSSALRTLPLGTSPGRVFYLDDLHDYEFWRKHYLPWSGWKK